MLRNQLPQCRGSVVDLLCLSELSGCHHCRRRRLFLDGLAGSFFSQETLGDFSVNFYLYCVRRVRSPCGSSNVGFLVQVFAAYFCAKARLQRRVHENINKTIEKQ